MNRRNFIRGLLVAGAGFTILPGAGRVWKAVIDQRAILNPEWVKAPYGMALCGDLPLSALAGKWYFISSDDEMRLVMREITRDQLHFKNG